MVFQHYSRAPHARSWLARADYEHSSQPMSRQLRGSGGGQFHGRGRWSSSPPLSLNRLAGTKLVGDRDLDRDQTPSPPEMSAAFRFGGDSRDSSWRRRPRSRSPERRNPPAACWSSCWDARPCP